MIDDTNVINNNIKRPERFGENKITYHGNINSKEPGNIGQYLIWLFIVNILGYFPWILSSYGLIPASFDFLWVMIGGLSPFIAAMIILRKEFGKEGPKIIFGRFNFKNCWITVFLSAVFVPIAIKGAVMIAYVLNGGDYYSEGLKLIEFLPVFIMMLLYNVWEEFGWRGYLLPALQDRIGPLKSAISVGLIQSIWHWPHFCVKNSTMAENYGNFLNFVIIVVCSSIINTYLFNLSKGNLAVASFYHASGNAAGVILLMNTGISGVVSIYLLIFNVIAAGIILLIAKFRTDAFNRDQACTLKKIAMVTFGKAKSVF